MLKEQAKSEEGLLQAVKTDVRSRLAARRKVKDYIQFFFFSVVFATFPSMSLMGLTCCD